VEEDLALLFDMLNDAPLQSLLIGLAKPRSREMVKAWLDDKLNDPNMRFLIAADGEQATGYVQLANIDWINRVGTLGICIAEQQRGLGQGAAAVKLLHDYARFSLNLRKIILAVRGDNEAAIKLYEKLGYRLAGAWKEHVWAGAAYCDVVLMEFFLDGSESVGIPKR
jgi:RimJ/RimL family protein N-acetyltransferase